MNKEPTISLDADVAPVKDGVGAKGAIRGVVALALIAIAVLFALQNSESVDVTFLSWDFSISKILLMLASALIGATLTFLFSAIRRRRSS